MSDRPITMRVAMAYRDLDRGRETRRRYAEAHQEEQRAANRKYQAANRERLREKARLYRLEHPKASAEAARRWRARHPARAQETDRRWKAANAEKVRERHRRRRQENPDKVREYSRVRRARMRGLPTDHHSRQQVFERDRGLCQLCDAILDPANWHEDHIVPISRGGPDTLANCQATCPLCNRRKAGRM